MEEKKTQYFEYPRAFFQAWNYFIFDNSKDSQVIHNQL